MMKRRRLCDPACGRHQGQQPNDLIPGPPRRPTQAASLCCDGAGVRCSRQDRPRDHGWPKLAHGVPGTDGGSAMSIPRTNVRARRSRLLARDGTASRSLQLPAVRGRLRSLADRGPPARSCHALPDRASARYDHERSGRAVQKTMAGLEARGRKTQPKTADRGTHASVTPTRQPQAEPPPLPRCGISDSPRAVLPRTP